jgi:hypothetical protein
VITVFERTGVCQRRDEGWTFDRRSGDSGIASERRAMQLIDVLMARGPTHKLDADCTETKVRILFSSGSLASLPEICISAPSSRPVTS